MPAEHFTEGRFTYRFNTGFHQHMVESADGALAREPDTRFFDPAFCESLSGAFAIEEGRGRAVAFVAGEQPLILKQYRRGGLVQRISRDAYVWTGLANTRAWREFDLLMRMSALELPTPNVYACRVERQGLLYRAHILVERISHSGSLQQSLNKGEAATVDWLSVGRTVGQLGRHCIYHADLNSSNILLDESGNTHLIDFDRGKLMQGRMVKRYRSYYEKRMLQRLRHSLSKTSSQETMEEDEGFKPSMWLAFLEGYRQSSPEATSATAPGAPDSSGE